MISLAFPAEDDLTEKTEKTEKKKLVGEASQSSKTAFACVPVTQCQHFASSSSSASVTAISRSSNPASHKLSKY